MVLREFDACRVRGDDAQHHVVATTRRRDQQVRLEGILHEVSGSAEQQVVAIGESRRVAVLRLPASARVRGRERSSGAVGDSGQPRQ